MAGWAQTNISFEPLVAEGMDRRLVSLVLQHLKDAFGRVGGLAPSRRVADAAAGDGQQPADGIGRRAVARPLRQRGGKGIGQRVLGGGDVTRARRQDREQLAIGRARRDLRIAGGVAARLVHQPAGGASTGRISTDPAVTQGARAAHSSAASRSATSMIT